MLEKELEQSPAFQNLCNAFASLKTQTDVQNFLRDIATISEIQSMAERLQAAELISQGMSYRAINEQTGVSTTTISRVAHWLHHGMGGYQTVLSRL
ncbi:helix-turn-helix domain-containing protein [Candidatus Peregrinibacteria bacterium]|nr:MAG: helix-turn-helix domain-containing protein [Candidatus Peregrinibacteria bacterium]